MSIHCRAPIGALWNAAFMNGRYVYADWSAVIADTPAISQRFENTPKANMDCVRERQLNR